MTILKMTLPIMKFLKTLNMDNITFNENNHNILLITTLLITYFSYMPLLILPLLRMPLLIMTLLMKT